MSLCNFDMIQIAKKMSSLNRVFNFSLECKEWNVERRKSVNNHIYYNIIFIPFPPFSFIPTEHNIRFSWLFWLMIWQIEHYKLVL